MDVHSADDPVAHKISAGRSQEGFDDAGPARERTLSKPLRISFEYQCWPTWPQAAPGCTDSGERRSRPMCFTVERDEVAARDDVRLSAYLMHKAGQIGC